MNQTNDILVRYCLDLDIKLNRESNNPKIRSSHSSSWIFSSFFFIGLEFFKSEGKMNKVKRDTLF